MEQNNVIDISIGCSFDMRGDVSDSIEELITKWEKAIEDKLRWEEFLLFRSVASRTVAQELVTVQPMAAPSGVYLLDYVYRVDSNTKNDEPFMHHTDANTNENENESKF